MPTDPQATAEIAAGSTVLQYGGQAVIEGVMMRSPRYFAVACRKPNGEIVVQREDVDKSILGKLKWLNVPFLRGTLAHIDAMALGSRALAFASHVQLEAEQASAAKAAAAGVGSSEISGEPTSSQVVSAELSAIAASAVNGPPRRTCIRHRSRQDQ